MKHQATEEAKLEKERLILTPSCGCGSLSVAERKKVFALLGRQVDVVRNKLE